MQLKYHTEHSSPKTIIPNRIQLQAPLCFRPKTNSPFSTLFVKPRKLFAPFPTKCENAPDTKRHQQRCHSIDIDSCDFPKNIPRIKPILRPDLTLLPALEIPSLLPCINPKTTLDSSSTAAAGYYRFRKGSLRERPIRPEAGKKVRSANRSVMCRRVATKENDATEVILNTTTNDAVDSGTTTAANNTKSEVQDPCLVTFSRLNDVFNTPAYTPKVSVLILCFLNLPTNPKTRDHAAMKSR